MRLLPPWSRAHPSPAFPFYLASSQAILCVQRLDLLFELLFCSCVRHSFFLSMDAFSMHVYLRRWEEMRSWPPVRQVAGFISIRWRRGQEQIFRTTFLFFFALAVNEDRV